MKFQENPLQTLANMRAQICQYLQRNVSQGIQLFVNLGSHIFESLQWIFLKLRRLTKFCTINRFMEMNFCVTS